MSDTTNTMTVRDMTSKGGRARAAGMTPGQRSEAARKAARERWAKTDRRTELYGLPLLLDCQRLSETQWRVSLAIGSRDEKWTDGTVGHGSTRQRAIDEATAVFVAKLSRQWLASVRTRDTTTQS